MGYQNVSFFGSEESAHTKMTMTKILMAKHFLRRGYPEDLVMDAMIEVRRMD